MLTKAMRVCELIVTKSMGVCGTVLIVVVVVAETTVGIFLIVVLVVSFRLVVEVAV